MKVDNITTSLGDYSLGIPTLNIFYLLKQIKPYGNIVYEYNPLRNYRFQQNQSENYLGDNKEGILKSGVYFFHGGLGIDEYTIFGDYFYVELLMRLYKDWNSYWQDLNQVNQVFITY